MKTRRHFFAAAAAASLLSGVATPPAPAQLPERSNLSREIGAIYFEDLTDQRVELLALEAVPIRDSLHGRRSVGTLKKGGTVHVLAMSDRMFQIRGMALHGQVKGWVPHAALESTEPGFMDKMHALHERKQLVDELIAANQIALGMTLEEVEASMGKPTRKTSKLDKDGRSDVYEYSTYERVAQYRTARDPYGRLYRQKYYVKVATGTLSVTFEDEVVQAIEETEGEPLEGADVKIVPVPIEIF